MSTHEQKKLKFISIIGTRPQYIKIKPFYDFCLANNITHHVVDTLQHYSYNVSQSIIDDLHLKIDYALRIENKNEISFLADSLIKIEEILLLEKPDFVLVYGDTNSTFCASLVCYKMKIPFAHVEANLRCGNIYIPEEVNRIFSDTVAQLRFCSSQEVVKAEDDIFCGDLEYELLNNIDPAITFKKYGVMTIHRQFNMNENRMKKIIDFCSQIPAIIKFFVHHRTQPFVEKMTMPKNVELHEPCVYSRMVTHLAECGFIITDSGGINKVAPFFGKKALIVREKIEWLKTEEKNFARKSKLDDEDLMWLLEPPPLRNKRFYLGAKNPSVIMYNSLMTYNNKLDKEKQDE